MSTVNGGVAGSIASQASQTLKESRTVNATSKTTSSFAQRTQGSVFGAAAGNFGALAMMPKAQGAPADNTRVAAIGAAYKNAPKSNVTSIGSAYNASNPQPNRTAGSIFGTGFGQMTTQGRGQPNMATNGLMTNSNVKADNFDVARHQEKNDDEKLTEALGMSATNIMMQAA